MRNAALLILLLAGAGCGQTEIGLASAPALGGAQIEPGRLRDVIANGAESCNRGGGGSPLRGHIPPCAPGEGKISHRRRAQDVRFDGAVRLAAETPEP